MLSASLIVSFYIGAAIVVAVTVLILYIFDQMGK